MSGVIKTMVEIQVEKEIEIEVAQGNSFCLFFPKQIVKIISGIEQIAMMEDGIVEIRGIEDDKIVEILEVVEVRVEARVVIEVEVPKVVATIEMNLGDQLIETNRRFKVKIRLPCYLKADLHQLNL